jgi:hypothetical protein
VLVARGCGPNTKCRHAATAGRIDRSAPSPVPSAPRLLALPLTSAVLGRMRAPLCGVGANDRFQIKSDSRGQPSSASSTLPTFVFWLSDIEFHKFQFSCGSQYPAEADTS